MRHLSLFIAILVAASLWGAPTAKDKSRAIVTTDLGGADPDDRQSMLHLLVSANLIDIEGIISTQAWVSDPDRTAYILQSIDNYAMAYPNLRRHAKGFPTPDYLKSVTKRGQTIAGMAGVGDGMDSEGSDLIIAAADKNDDRPLWILAWGGMNTLAQAIRKVQSTRSPQDLDAFLKKLRVYDVLGQDDAGAWIAKNFPALFYIRNTAVYGWQPDDNWIKTHIQSVPPLGACYPDRIWAYEGDSPSFLYLLANGVNDPEHAAYGGWGGRFDNTPQRNIPAMDWVRRNNMDESQYADYYMLGSAPEGVQSIRKWNECIWNDFAARMVWASTPDFKKANHAPEITVNGDSRLTPLTLYARPGEIVTLNASKTKDPDRDAISFAWEVYEEISGPVGKDILSDADTHTCSVRIPATLAHGELHIILKAKDNGTPALTSCRRIVIKTR